MSKVFDPIVGNRSGLIEVTDLSGGDEFAVISHGKDIRFHRFENDTAPALCLAILEAAGYTAAGLGKSGSEYKFSMVLHHLRTGIDTLATERAEAKEQAELEAEALALYWVRYPDSGVNDLKNSGELAGWLAVAKKARELAGK